MRRGLTVFLILMLVFGLLGCEAAESPDELMLESILFVSKETLDRELIGQTRQQILDRWGQPNGVITDAYGDFFRIPFSDQIIVIFYSPESFVTRVEIVRDSK